MTTYSQAFGGQGGGAILDYQVFPSSQIYTVQYDGVLDVLAIAASGSGSVGNQLVAGAGAGECAWRRAVRVYKGDTLTITIGGGGAGVTAAYNAAVAGNAGGDTVITSSRGWSITVRGGRGGTVGGGTSLLGGRGGTGGSGGDVHVPGGNGGDIILCSGTGNCATGGGAPNLFNVPADLVRGGNINLASASGVGTGGAGVKGRGGDITSANSSTAGGGFGGNARDNAAGSQVVNIGPNAWGLRSVASPGMLIPGIATWGLDVFGGGGNSSNSATPNAGPGGGSAGNIVGAGSTSPQAAYMAGSGGFVLAATSVVPSSGPGLCCTSASLRQGATSGSTSSTAAGDGQAVIILRQG